MHSKLKKPLSAFVPYQDRRQGTTRIKADLSAEKMGKDCQIQYSSLAVQSKNWAMRGPNSETVPSLAGETMQKNEKHLPQRTKGNEESIRYLGVRIFKKLLGS